MTKIIVKHKKLNQDIIVDVVENKTGTLFYTINFNGVKVKKMCPVKERLQEEINKQIVSMFGQF